MSTIRFIDHSEIHYVYDMFSIDSSMVGVKLTPDEVDVMIKKFQNHMKEGTFKIVMMFDDNGVPEVMYTGLILQRVQGWWVSATKIRQPTNHFATSARKMAPALDFMIRYMEESGYYKFWMGAPENHHNIRNTVMKKYSNTLSRYQWFDEMVIPRGEKANVAAYDYVRRICDWSDIVVRLFVLDQKYRVEHLQKQNHQDYKGTVLDA